MTSLSIIILTKAAAKVLKTRSLQETARTMSIRGPESSWWVVLHSSHRHLYYPGVYHHC